MTSASVPAIPRQPAGHDPSRLSGLRLGGLLALSALPVLLTTAVMMALGSTIATDTVRTWIRPLYVSHLVYAAANWAVVGAALILAGGQLRQAGLRFSPTWGRLRLGVIGFAIGIAVYLVVDRLLMVAGLPSVAGMQFNGARSLEVFVLWVGPVVTAPLAEEILFRAIWIGALSQRIPAPVAVVCSTIAFAAIHYPYFGIGGVIFISAWGLVPAALFLRTRDLAAPLAMHVLNNMFAYLIAPFFLPQL